MRLWTAAKQAKYATRSRADSVGDIGGLFCRDGIWGWCQEDERRQARVPSRSWVIAINPGDCQNDGANFSSTKDKSTIRADGYGRC